MELKSAAKASASRKKAAVCGSQSDEMPGSQSSKPLQPFGASAKASPSNRVPSRATGGRIANEESGENLGMSARASGRAGKGKTVVNVIVAPQGGGQAPMPMPVPPPMPMPLPDGGGMPSVADKPAGGLPMAGAPMPPPTPAQPPMPGRATGGRVGKFTGGAAGGRGRLEKAEHAKKDRCK